ncbi:MAG: DUF2125 domain-containing protein, partial [Marinosulfonomonas sp.]|nr:DUF2125 domain-containing protein [Marinosulfonomonas sp.]
MRKLIWLAIVFSCLWAGYWFVVAAVLQGGLEKYLPQQHGRNDPIQITYSDLSVRGFPKRFDIHATDITLTGSEKAARWKAPFFRISALSYKPYHITAALPPTQTLRWQGEELQITSDEIEGRVEFLPASFFDKALEIERSSFMIRNVAVASSLGWETALNEGSITIARTDATQMHYDLKVTIRAITLPDQMRRLFDPAHLQSGALDSFSLDSTLVFTNPLSLLATCKNTPDLSEITVKGMAFIWGDVQFLANGRLQIDGNGTPNGTLSLTAHNWQK